jgi:hypothetical protein
LVKKLPLPSVGLTALSKETFFVECRLGHSTKTPSPSTRRRNGCFSLPSAREKVLGKEGFADALCDEPSLPSATLGKAFAECF